MIRIPLTKNKCALIDDRDSHLLNYKWYYDQGYARKSLWVSEGKIIPILLHHTILGCPLNKFQIDHINGDKLDNRRNNLRIVTKRENMSNLPIHRSKNKSSKYVGVYLYKRKYKNRIYKYWLARIQTNNKTTFLGTFKTEARAANAYKKALENL